MEWLNFSWVSDPESWVALVTLVILELVLGVDNVIFISILAGKLPEAQRDRARMTGIAMAVITRVLLLLSLSWIISLEEPLFTLPLLNVPLSGHDLILLAGGLFLLWKSVHEIHDRLEGVEGHASSRVYPSFWGVIVQIMLLDIVFSLDSVITAVGMANVLMIMIIAVILAALVMIFASGPIGHFVEEHPTIKMLALAFLLLIGFTLIIEGVHYEIPKGYIYFAMGFSVFVELLNLRLRARASQPVNLREPYVPEGKLATAPVGVPAPVRSKPAPAARKPKPKGKKRR
jgi:predicted tellurium resistance membrane protein TerC